MYVHECGVEPVALPSTFDGSQIDERGSNDLHVLGIGKPATIRLSYQPPVAASPVSRRFINILTRYMVSMKGQWQGVKSSPDMPVGKHNKIKNGFSQS